MRVLVFNCGSSSLKYRLIDMADLTELAGGEAQRVGPKTAEPSRIVHRVDGHVATHMREMRDHAEAFREVMGLLEYDLAHAPDAVGHRVVHGGDRFTEHAVIDEAVLAALDSIVDLAPIHNPPAVTLIRACHVQYPGLPQVAVFDTAYHATIPSYASTYAIPRDVIRRLNARKYGFHGISHEYVVGQAARLLGKPVEQLNAVSCHLGSGGASLCAVVNGRSVDNTMGFSPLQGLIMSTRCGDLDPAVTLRMLAAANGDSRVVEHLLNTQSGVLGLSGFSADIRDVLTQDGNSARARVTRQTYLWRIRKYLGAYLAVVNPADAVIFTDTIGEGSPDVRWAVASDMGWFGLELDPHRNQSATLPADISTASSPVRAMVIATNEELAIAQYTQHVLEQTVARV